MKHIPGLRSVLQPTLALLNASERRRLGFLSVANAFLSLADILSLAALLIVLNFYTQESGSLVKYLPAIGTRHPLWPAALFLLLFVLKHLIAYKVYDMQAHFAYKVASRISRNQLLRYFAGDYRDYVSVDSARQNHLISHQPVEFAHYVLSGIQQIFSESLLIGLAIAAVLAYSPGLFLMLAVFLMPAVWLSAYLMRKRLRAARGHVQADAPLAMQYLNESLQGFVEGHIYGSMPFFSGRYHLHQARLNQHLADVQVAQWIPGRLVEIFAVLGLFLLIGVNQTYGTVVSTISIGAFVAAAYKIIPGIGRIANLGGQVRTYAYTLTSLAKADDTEHEEPSVFSTACIRSIAFRNVSFSYGDKPVLRNFSLQLGSGDFACLRADSGRGKTTVLHLLLGFVHPDSGDILINETAADREALMHWRRRVAYVKQQNFLIHDTILRNITLSDGAHDEPRLQQAIEGAGLLPFIQSFPEGRDKIISDSGRNISGGQRQRIALARAFYKDSDLLILDEPFNELDAASEQSILQHLTVLAAAGRIIILVSHSSRTPAGCNKILQIDA